MAAGYFTVDNDHMLCVKTDRRPFVGLLANERKTLWKLACQRKRWISQH